MSNSSLVSHTNISPNKTSPRNKPIDIITPHCVVGQCSVETLGNIFAPVKRQASSNYGIGVDGRVGMYCEEKDRSWCTSSGANDHRAVTIECASDTTAPYAFKEVVYNRLIDLCADICKRNGKKKLLWFGDKEKTLSYKPAADEMLLTVHRWFANKSCPGDWMYSRMGDLAAKVTTRLSGGNPDKEEKPAASDVIYRVQVGAYKNKGNAAAMLAKVKAAGFSDAYIKADKTEQKETPTPAPTKKSVDKIAREVIAGKWGNGDDRKNRLTAAGYDYGEVRARVNALMK